MNKKIMMLALAAVSAVLFALPTVASATFLHAHKAANPSEHPGSFSGTGGTSEWTMTNGLRLTGTSTTVTGAFETTTTGWLEITYHHVTGPLGSTCTGTAPAQPAGTLKTTKLTFHLVTIDGGSQGILITPSHDGIFAHYECGGIARTITGNGIVGTIVKPKCSEASTAVEIKFERVSQGHQKHRLVTGVSYDMHDNTGSTFSTDTSTTINYGQSSTLTCT